MLARVARRVGLASNTRRMSNYSIRVTRETDVSFAVAHVDSTAHTVLLNGCWSVTALAGAAAFYQFVTNLHTVPITGRTQVVVFSREDDTEMGNQHAKEALAGKTIINNGPRFKMVKDVATRLVAVADKIFDPGFHWQIYLIDDPQVNACCFMGGKMFVYTGLLDFIDATVEQGIVTNKYNAIATVLGHEISHALARHTAETLSYLPLLLALTVMTVDSTLISSLCTFLWQLPFSRMHEKEADHIGLMLMAAACYDPSEVDKSPCHRRSHFP
ncbi:metalloendopeptidase [Aphanomyces cochlioides]|nr:metalloendopeptidase [Aphanomyces cochlioides]